MTGKNKRKSREAKRAALKARQEAERARERDEIALGRFSPHVPASAQIPTKTVRVGRDLEVRAELEDEHFGGFRETNPGPSGGDDPGDRYRGASAFNRVWGRADITVERGGLELIWPRPNISLDLPGRRQGGASKPTVGPEHRVRRVLDSRRKVAWQRVPRRWATERATNGPWPFLLREEWEAFGKALPRHCDPGEGVPEVERDLRGVGRYVPTSRALEERRLARVRPPRIKNLKLFPRQPVDRAAMRAEWELKVSDYLFDGFKIEQCPPETTTAMLNKRKVGRPRIHASNAEKQKRWRDKQQKLCLITASPPPAGGEQEHGHDIGKYQGHPRGLDSGSSADAKRKTAG